MTAEEIAGIYYKCWNRENPDLLFLLSDEWENEDARRLYQSAYFGGLCLGTPNEAAYLHAPIDSPGCVELVERIREQDNLAEYRKPYHQGFSLDGAAVRLYWESRFCRTIAILAALTKNPGLRDLNEYSLSQWDGKRLILAIGMEPLMRKGERGMP